MKNVCYLLHWFWRTNIQKKLKIKYKKNIEDKILKLKKTHTLRVTWRQNLVRVLVGFRLGVRDTVRDPVLVVWQTRSTVPRETLSGSVRKHPCTSHPYTQQKPCSHQSPWCVARWGQRWSGSPKEVAQSANQASFVVTLLCVTVVRERTFQEIVGLHFGYCSVVVLWQACHRSASLWCTWCRHSSSITLFFGFCFWQKKR